MRSKYTYGFEKLEVWKRSRKLASKLYLATREFPESEKFGITSQIRRAAISIPSNIAEGSTRSTKNDQARFYQIAYGSAIELINQILIAQDIGYIAVDVCEELRTELQHITYQINNLRKSIRDSNTLSEPSEEYNLQSSQPSKPSKPSKPSQPSQPSKPSQPLTFFAHKTAIIDEGARIGEGTKIWHFCHVMPGAVIGKNCGFGQNVFIANGVVLGDNVKVQNNVSIYEGVICEDDVFLGPSVVFTNITNPRSAIDRKGEYAKTRVGKGATIGANATIVCGHDIGAYAFVGAAAVVTKDVPAYALVVGNPAKQIGWMSAHGERLEFNAKGSALCPATGAHYLLRNGSVTRLLSSLTD